MEDILTVLWKEAKAVPRFQGRRSQLIFTLLTPALMAAYMPWTMGPRWASGYISLFIAIATPLLLVGITISDSFAGERERHTLETLLASRLQDGAILYGKLFLWVLVGWLVTLGMLLFSVVVLNLTHYQGQLLFFKPGVFFTDLVISLLLAVFVASLGVLISLRSPTVQQAQQTLLGSILLLPLLLGFVPPVILSMPDGAQLMRQFLAQLNAGLIITWVIVVFLVVDLLLLYICQVRFRRSSLALK